MAALVPRGLSIRPPVRYYGAVFRSTVILPTSLTYLGFQSSVGVRSISMTPPSMAKTDPPPTAQPIFTAAPAEESKKILSKLSARPSGKTAKYATDLFVNSVHNNVLDHTFKDAKWLLRALSNYELKLALRDRSIPREPLYNELQKQGNLHPITIQFLAFLESQKQMAEITSIFTRFVEVAKDYNNESDIIVTVAEKPRNPKEFDVLVNILKILYLKEGAKATVTTVVDPTILGGFQAQVGDIALDRTLKSDIDFRDKKIETWISTIKSWEEINKPVKPETKFQADVKWINKMRDAVEEKRKANDPNIKALERRLKLEEENLKKLQEQPLLHDQMDQILNLHQSQAVEKDATKLSNIQKEIDVLVRQVAERVKRDPVMDDWLYQSKISHWKYKVLVSREGPLQKIYQKVITLLEGKIHTVEFHPSSTDETYKFDNLKKLSPKELADVPVEEFQKLSLSQLSQLPLQQLQEVLNEQLSDYGPDAIPFNTDNLEVLPQMKQADADAVLFLINNQLQDEYETKRFAVEIYLADKAASQITSTQTDPVDAYQLARLPVPELQKQGYLPATFPSLVDENIARLSEKRARAEKILRDAGLSPLPQFV